MATQTEFNQAKNEAPEVTASYDASPHPLRVVAGWELWRIASSRSSWIAASVVFIFVLLITWTFKEIAIMGIMAPQEERISVHGSSAWGMAFTIPLVLLVFGLAIPFLSAEGVARDFKQRTHEVLMSTPMPTWAYVWGRYMATLAVCLALAVLMLSVMLLAGVALWAAMGEPFPNVGGTLALWAVAVLPATLLVSGISFALGTLLPRYSNFVKVFIVVAWFLASYQGLPARGGDPTSAYWDPTSRALVSTLDAPYRQALFKGIYVAPTRSSSASGQQVIMVPATQLTPAEQVQKLRERMFSVEQVMPDLWPWVGPHVVLCSIGLVVVGFAAVRFRRFESLL